MRRRKTHQSLSSSHLSTSAESLANTTSRINGVGTRRSLSGGGPFGGCGCRCGRAFSTGGSKGGGGLGLLVLGCRCGRAFSTGGSKGGLGLLVLHGGVGLLVLGCLGLRVRALLEHGGGLKRDRARRDPDAASAALGTSSTAALGTSSAALGTSSAAAFSANIGIAKGFAAVGFAAVGFAVFVARGAGTAAIVVVASGVAVVPGAFVGTAWYLVPAARGIALVLGANVVAAAG